MGRVVWIVGAFLWFAGCTLVSSVNDYSVGDSGASVEDQDFQLTVAAMHPHGAQNVDFVVYDDESLLITARALVRMPPVPEGGIDDYPDVSFTMPSALPAGSEYTVSFFADVNGNGVADPFPTDHSWTEPISAEGEVDFSHNTMFDDVTDLGLKPIGADVVIHLEADQDLPALISGQSQVIEVRLSLAGTERVLGLLQIHPDPETELPDTFRLVGIADSGNTYDVRAFADGRLIEGSEQTVNAPSEGDLEITVRESQLDL